MSKTRLKQISTNEFYDLPTEEKEVYIEFIKRKILREKNTKPLYFKMMNLVEKIFNHYHSDFYIVDFNIMTTGSNNTGKYLWLPYDCGSRIVRLDSDFRGEMFSRISDAQMFLKHFHYKSTKLFIVDAEAQTIKEIKPSDVNRSLFSNRYGEIKQYFDQRLQSLPVEKKHTINSEFKDLMTLYRDKPPIDLVEALFKPTKEYRSNLKKIV